MTTSGRTRVAAAAAVVLAAATQLLAGPSGGDANGTPAFARFLNRSTEPVPYAAWRRLEANCGRASGWLEARTELTRSGAFHYRIIGEGGAGSVRNRVLRKVLKAEEDSFRRGTLRRAWITQENYRFQPAGNATDGLFKLFLQPLRKDSFLIDGAAYLDPGDGELVRVEGRLVKRPSFWSRNVRVVRHYGRVGGMRVPVETTSTADIVMFGPSSFVMRYSYESVNGRFVRTAVDARRALADGTSMARLGNE